MRSSAASGGGSLRVICGPTAAGKSALALQLAEQFGATIVSADSRQVYRRFDIGTAKPDRASRERVPHMGVDVAEPDERYSAARWAREAGEWLEACERSRQPAVVVGGTGFYIRALTDPLFDSPALDVDHRAAIERELDDLGTEELRARCDSVDPARAHLGRAQLIRALVIVTLTGTPISEWYGRSPHGPAVRGRYLVVDPGARLTGRIEERVRGMIDAGWPDEVRALQHTVAPDAPAWNATGYATVRDYVRGDTALDDAQRRIVIATRQYAKRQRTWFRHQLPADRVTQLDPLAPDAWSRAEAWWMESEDR
ncbi:MAG: tRNA (adenosine(37)-N6)-dimethylallyltransferase MiaA [Gemmatimonadaceae bacterium]